MYLQKGDFGPISVMILFGGGGVLVKLILELFELPLFCWGRLSTYRIVIFVPFVSSLILALFELPLLWWGVYLQNTDFLPIRITTFVCVCVGGGLSTRSMI